MRRFSHFLLALIGLAVPSAARGQPPINLYQDFRNQNALQGGLTLAGVAPNKFIDREAGGYRINLPATRKTQAPIRGVGIAGNLQVAGDFQITATYELLAAGPVTGNELAGVDLFYIRGPDGKRHG